MALKTAKLTIRKSRNGKWYWRLQTRNGRIVCDGGQGYSSKYAAERGFWGMKSAVTDSTIEVEVAS